MKNIKDAIKHIRNKLRYWEYLYYVENNPEVSDLIYDQWMNKLRILENKHPHFITTDSPTQRIGGVAKNTFKLISHIYPMLSLDNVLNESELLSFDKKIRVKLKSSHNEIVNISYCCELKIDGIAISLIYYNGILTNAATRGDGFNGEDVTDNVRTIRSIPLVLMEGKHTIPNVLEIRGEAFMSNIAFKKLNKLFLNNGNKLFSNSRNAAAGSLRQIDSSVTANRSLDFFCYNITRYLLNNNTKNLPDSHWLRLQICKSWGIPISIWTHVCSDIDSVLEYYKRIKDIRSTLGFNIDGIVIKVDSVILQNRLGSSLRAPRWAVSYKFPPKQAVSIVCDVRFHVSRTGILTPVASLKPVIISGVLIQHVNLYNVDEIFRLGLMIGDSVIVQRSGDVIPRIIQVVFSERFNRVVRPIVYPTYCPVCYSIIDKNMTCSKVLILRCNAGLSCSAQRREILKHFASRRAMNIVGMGERMIDRLIESNFLFTPVDFFRLNMDVLVSLNGVRKKSAERLLHAIEISKQTTYVRFIYSLGIPHVGSITAVNLVQVFHSIDQLMLADISSLLSIRDIGTVVAYSIFNFFRNDYNLRVVHELLKIVVFM